MRRLSLLLGLLPALPIVLAAGACNTEQPVEIGLVLLSPLGLLDEATGIRLTVFNAKGATCEPSGHVDAIPSGDGVQHFDLKHTGCAGGVGWCKEITLDRDGTEKMFAVVATGPAGILGEGCVTAKIDQDPLEINIKVQRYNPEACCDDGEVQPGEQCDFGPAAGAVPGCIGTTADEVCDPSCLAQEVLLSIDNTAAPALSNGPPGSKSQLSMAFCPGSAKVPNGLHSVFRNNDANTAIGGSDIHVRTLDSSLYTVTDPFPHSQQLRLPLLCTDVAGTGIVRQQETPAIAPVGTGAIAIAYASDGAQPTLFDIMLNVQNPDGCADAPAIEVSMTGADPPPGSVNPDVAGGPADAALIVWTRGGRVLGRIRQTNGALLPSGSELDIAQNATAVRVAGSGLGWVVAYQGSGAGDADGIFTKTVTVGAVTGPETPVNVATDGLQDQSDIAMLDDGRFAVVWHSKGDIYFQRYDAAGMRVAGDQDAPLNTVTAGEQQFPAVAAGVGSFAVAWEDGSGGIAARFAGGSTGFGYNHVTGQNDAFSAAHPGVVGQRHLPAVAIGGGGFVAIGWQDDSQGHPGVYVRRFPLPR